MDPTAAVLVEAAPYAATFQPQSTQGLVLCCMCGTRILSNPSNMCVNCIRSQVDITQGLQKQVTVLYCKGCGRYLQPPKHWLRAELESKELLTFCIKRVKGLQKVKLVDAGFIWTEPHSKRLKVKLTIQAEVLNGAILQQTFVIEYVVEDNMCPDCTRRNANPNVWRACAQVRQHVFHKRTFFYLEQLILKHSADEQCINIRSIHEGIDFFFATRPGALKFIDFLQAVVPVRFRTDKQLISHDTHNNTYNYKFTFSIEVAPICKDDLICLPKEVAKSLGNLGPLVLCTRVTNHMVFTDPTTLRSMAMDGPVYWRHGFTAMLGSRALVEFVVLDVEPVDNQQQQQQQQGSGLGRFTLADVTVARASDFGKNDTTFFVRTHLGHLLHPGDMALGYDLSTANMVGIDIEAFFEKGGQVPDVMLVRKSFEESRRKRRAKGRSRGWKLRQLAMEVDDGNGKTNGIEQEEMDRERFLEELEEDPDLRSRINIYKVDAAQQQQQQPRPAQHPSVTFAMDDAGEDGDDEGEAPDIPLEELLDDLEALALADEEEEEEEGSAAPEDMMED